LPRSPLERLKIDDSESDDRAEHQGAPPPYPL